jgi:hypothetical protein
MDKQPTKERTMKDSGIVTFDLVSLNGVKQGTVSLDIDAIVKIEQGKNGMRTCISSEAAWFWTGPESRGLQARIHRAMAERLEEDE